eukprot:TRINITY_DN7540_c3_g2_i2.p1 TRINITY_DN7540_c3_g2~~TRINITY_DN7540_c3_g2_i2.p1  ORF type:complete len:874 (+),score=116.77 TRINITY_DN7540_c3_g2_i2:126-2747(+)
MHEKWRTPLLLWLWLTTLSAAVSVLLISNGDLIPLMLLSQNCLSPIAGILAAVMKYYHQGSQLGLITAVHTLLTSAVLLCLLGSSKCVGMVAAVVLLPVAISSSGNKNISICCGVVSVITLVASDIVSEQLGGEFKELPTAVNIVISVGALCTAMLQSHFHTLGTSIVRNVSPYEEKENIQFSAEEKGKIFSKPLMNRVMHAFDTPKESVLTSPTTSEMTKIDIKSVQSEDILKPPVKDLLNRKIELEDSISATLLSVSIPIQVPVDIPCPPAPLDIMHSGVAQLGFPLSPPVNFKEDKPTTRRRANSLPLMRCNRYDDISPTISPHNKSVLTPKSQVSCQKCSNPTSKYCCETGEPHEVPRTPHKGRSRVRLLSTMGVNATSSVRMIKKTMHWKRGDIIGQGGFGTVHIGLNVETGELMAVKNIQFNIADKNIATKIRQLQNEIEIMRPLNHPHIVRYFFMEKVDSYGGTGASINIFMEYVPGGSIQKLLSSFGPLGETTVVQYTYQILVGLAHLHSKGIIHRDIKGANILLTVEGCIKLADFGASVLVENKGIKDRQNDVQGTPYWMAPEVLCEKGHGWEADIWSLGCTVMEMLTAQHPWQHLGQTQVQVLNAIMNNSKALTVPDTITSASAMFLKDCLSRDPSKRPTAQLLIEHHYFLEDADDITRDVDKRRLSRSGSTVKSRRCSLASVFSGGVVMQPSFLDSPEENSRNFGRMSICSSVRTATASLVSPRGAFGAQFRSPRLCGSPRPSRLASQASIVSDWPSFRSYSMAASKVATKRPANVDADDDDKSIAASDYDPAMELNKWQKIRNSFIRQDSILKHSVGVLSSNVSSPQIGPRRGSPSHPGSSFRRPQRKLNIETDSCGDFSL